MFVLDVTVQTESFNLFRTESPQRTEVSIGAERDFKGTIQIAVLFLVHV